jgi:hypothetical protein
VRRHRIERAGATRAEAVADLLDLVGLAVERAADHQESAPRAEAIDLRDHRLGGGRADNHLVHGAENDTPLVHALVLPGRFGFSPVLETI